MYKPMATISNVSVKRVVNMKVSDNLGESHGCLHIIYIVLGK